MARRLRSALGFTLLDTMMTVAIGATIAAFAVPTATTALGSMRLKSNVRQVERELQTARLRAVSKNRPMALRLNCPAAGQFRIVEITGVAGTDSALNRCDPDVYPYPGPKDNDPATPEHDGPVQTLDVDVTVRGPVLVFGPNGVTRRIVNGEVETLNGTEDVVIGRESASVRVTINALGKIAIH